MKTENDVELTPPTEALRKHGLIHAGTQGQLNKMSKMTAKRPLNVYMVTAHASFRVVITVG